MPIAIKAQLKQEAHTNHTRNITGKFGSGDQGDYTREESHRTLVAYGNSTNIRRHRSST